MTDIPGGPVVKTPSSNAEGLGLISGPGIKIPHATWVWQKKKKKKAQCLTQRWCLVKSSWASQVALVVKNPPANAGDIRDAGSKRV